jgi:CRISPR-associated protein Csb2
MSMTKAVELRFQTGRCGHPPREIVNPTVEIRFPARRYHATPWGHHVNEGLIEWPPSPWRLLRALMATGFTAGPWDEHGPPPTGRSLIEKLAGVLPVYHLPRAAGAHTRHYMPIDKLDKAGQPNRTLVFDTWAQVDEGALTVTWKTTLTADEADLLSALAERMGYLGRSESWTQARLLDPEDPLPATEACVPSDAPPPPGWEQVSLLAPQPPPDYDQWRDVAVREALTAAGSGGRKPTKHQREKAVEPYPRDLIDCLQVETGFLRKHGWSQPPGTRRVFYHRPVDALESGAPRPRFKPATAAPVQAMLLALSTAGGNLHALPPVTRTLPQAELFHRALTRHATRDGGTCPAITGCDRSGRPLRGPHDHAHVLPLDLDGDGHLDHLLIWASGGLDGDAQAAVRSVRKTYAKGQPDPLRVALAGAGELDDLRCLPGEPGRQIRAILGPADGGLTWISRTPFVAPRYLKKSGRNTLTGQVAAELASRKLPKPQSVTVLEPGDRPERLRHRHFIRVRGRGPKPPIDFGYSLEVRLDEPITGPLCLGYGSHFGLGRFESVGDGR